MRPSILFYCQHSLGMGHLVRSMALAAGLTERFRVVFLNGGPMPRGIKLAAGVEIIDLPPLGLDSDGRLVSRESGYSVDSARSLRRKIILDTFRSLRPQAVLIELFPFGRKKFADELLPLLDEARETGQSRTLVVCSLRDILVGRQGDQQKHDDRAVAIANRYFDAILVHSDPEFARLEESFHACSRLNTPVHYTGYVSPERSNGPESIVIRHRRIVVSAGGGLVGYPLLQTAVESARALRDENVEMKVIAGPFLPDESWQSLCAAARGREGVKVVRSVPDLYGEMRAAAASVSQCGYNTTLDILESGVPALVVPFSDGSEDEQAKRAERLERLGAVRVLDQRQMNADRLADEIKALLRFTPQAPALDLNGARNSARILERLIEARRSDAKQEAHV
ncbi:MAG TPA: glycosyltransferase [Blastocatellia bacterium]|nr:glycosyltransferase [Blastocatellia bacterium]